MKNQNRNSFVPYRGPVIGDPDAGLLPSPYEFHVPKPYRYRGAKTLAILIVGFVVALYAFGVFG